MKKNQSSLRPGPKFHYDAGPDRTNKNITDYSLAQWYVTKSRVLFPQAKRASHQIFESITGTLQSSSAISIDSSLIVEEQNVALEPIFEEIRGQRTRVSIRDPKTLGSMNDLAIKYSQAD